MSHLKIHRTHLQRQAVVYLRQSTMKQVHEHRESTERQYALARRATELGWPSEQIEVIDEDLGQSGASTQWRSGFKRLAEQVSQGQVGVIFALEVSRLARSSADWHQLLDLCGWADVLIADEQSVFTPNDPNDRLLLGLKGQMSEAERYWMRLRLNGAQQSKARRGELRLIAPIGYVWNPAARRLCFDPDEQIQHAIRVVFERFWIDGSAGAVMAYFIDHGLSFPKHKHNPSGELVQARLDRATVLEILHSPIYTGAYVYGRREYRTVFKDGKLKRGQVTKLAPESWKVCLKEQHDAYISWDEFMANQDKLDSNRNRRRDAGRPGAASKGQALLQGLVLCGRCGYRMSVQQGGQALPRYICNAPVLHGESMKVCWSVAANAIDKAVSRCFLNAVYPPEVELAMAVAKEAERQGGELEKQWKSRLDRARYEAELAERRYKAVDPDNRVVARTLEADWEKKLRDLAELKRTYEQKQQTETVSPSENDRAQLLSLCKDLPMVWNATTTSNAQRKNMLRLLIQQVALTPIDIPKRMTRIQILWNTGATTELTVERKLYNNGGPTDAQIVERIREMATQGWTDRAIAAELNQRGISPKLARNGWNEQSIRSIRKRRGIGSTFVSLGRGELHPLQRGDGLYSIRGICERLGLSRRTVRGLVDAGKLVPVEGRGRGRPHWFALTPEIEKIVSSRQDKDIPPGQRGIAGGES
jgi:DNA invertase Pin-like site-specific DNA recombinase